MNAINGIKWRFNMTEKYELNFKGKNNSKELSISKTNTVNSNNIDGQNIYNSWDIERINRVAIF